MSVAYRPSHASLTLAHGTIVYGPLALRGEYVEFVHGGEKYKCHVDEFVESTRADLIEVGVSGPPDREAGIAAELGMTRCTEQRHLLRAFGEAVRELLRLHEQQFTAIVAGDADSHRFDLLIHMANEKKQQAKYDYLRHVEEHGCVAPDGTDER